MQPNKCVLVSYPRFVSYHLKIPQRFFYLFLVDIVGGLFYCLILHKFFWQSHSLQCTESFMRENVVEELQQMQPDDETKQKMLDILKRFHSEEETDSMDVDGMLLYFCLLWECWLLLNIGENIT